MIFLYLFVINSSYIPRLIHLITSLKFWKTLRRVEKIRGKFKSFFLTQMKARYREKMNQKQQNELRELSGLYDFVYP